MLRILVSLLLLTISTQAQRLFIGSYNSDSTKDGIYVYNFNPKTGDLQPATTFKGILNPSYLTLSKDGKHIYAATDTRTAGKGSVSSFQVDKDIRLTAKQSSGGENPVYVSLHKSGRWLVNANYTGGSLSVYPVSEDGRVAAAAQVITFKDSSITERQKSSHIHSANFSPSYDYVFFPDLGADKIRCYRFFAERQQPLEEYGATHTIPGSGPRHMAFHPNGKYVYSLEEMAGYISVYKYANGQLDSIQRISAHDTEHELYGSADIHISPDGKFLYASNRGDENNIAIYHIQTNGKLILTGLQDTGGEHPRNFTLDPSGNYLLVANQISGDVVVFKRDLKTGKLTQQQKIKILVPSCLKFI